MSKPEFVHLHVHSDYSLLDGAVKPKHLAARAAELEMPALALTDSGNLFGAIDFYEAATRHGLRPILGMELFVSRGSHLDKSPRNRSLDHLVLLAENRTGWRNLIRLSTEGYVEGFYYRPRVDYEFLEDHAEGLIALSSGMSGAVARELLEGRPAQATEMAARHKDIFGGRFYLEVQDHGIQHQRALIPQLADMGRKLDVPLVATNDVHYLSPNQAEAQEVLVLIGQQRTVQDGGRFRAGTHERHFRTAAEMAERFAGMPESLSNTLAIAERCRVEIEFGKLLLPDFPLPEAFTVPDDYLDHLAREGLRARYDRIDETLSKRLDFELGIIRTMGYAGYFLIVRDFIHHARTCGISVGPGRGSAAGSLVAYCLGITDIDPIRFDLLFERFLNPERVSMPDIDVDFDYRRRGEVIDYVKKKYGDDCVTQIITFGTMAARGVIRDTGRALGLEFGEIDRIAKLVPAELGITLEKALEQEPELRQVAEADEEHRRLIETARTLEGLARHASTHAAGVLIAPSRLDEVAPLFRSSREEISTQWDMKAVEKIGLLKMDFLGLRTLTVIEDALDLIEERTGARPDLAAVPLDDAVTFELLRAARTVAIFQLESAGMRDLLRKLTPSVFEDIVAVNALYRPGPMGSGMVDDFIDCRHGRKQIRYEHPILEPILESTYGMMVYQEQVMRIASDVAGFSLGESDILRRAMGKKKKAEMDAQEIKFVSGAVERGIPEPTARKIFEQMAYFAGYGFNKSHSAAYALVSYHTAYLKAHHPAEFMAAAMTNEMDTTDRIMVLVEECRQLGLPVLPPDINSSRGGFRATDQGIRFGLGAVKNVGRGAIEEIVREREANGPFRDIFDLTRRVPHEHLNKRVLESLVAAGALDELHPSRARQYAAAGGALDSGGRHQQDMARGQTLLFDVDSGGGVAIELPDVPEWDRRQKLKQEKEVIGFYLSEHPLDDYRDEIAAVASGDVARLKEMHTGAEVGLLGVISSINRKTDRKNRSMAFVTVEDFSGTLECIVFSRLFEEVRDLVTEDRVVLVRGRLDRREEDSDPKVVADSLVDFEESRAALEHTLYLRIGLEDHDEQDLDRIREALRRYPGKGEVVLTLHAVDGRRVKMKAGGLGVGVEPGLLRELRDMLGDDAVRLGEAANGRNGR